MIYPENFKIKTGFDKIIQLLYEYCLSGLGRSFVDSLEFSTSKDFLKNELAKTKEFKDIVQFEDEFPFSNFLDLRETLKRITPEGTHIGNEELFDFFKSLKTIYAIVQFLNKKQEEYPHIYALAGNISVHKEIIQSCNRIIDDKGLIKDSASPELGEIRHALAKKKSSISRIMQKILKSSKAEGLIPADTELSVRDGRLVIPVNTFHKRKIKGIILDESASGKTSFIEPTESFELNNEINKLIFDEKREIVKILTAFTSSLRPFLPDLEEAYHFLGTIDFLRAKAKLAISLNAVSPQISEHRKLYLTDARHPLLYLSHKNTEKPVIPLNLELDSTQRILLISGPNAGGKSVCLKTVGLLQYMLQNGLLIPVDERSEMGIFNNIFIDIGDEQSIENDLSTYSSHLYNMKHFVSYANKDTLLLIDEFGTGTEPLLGGAIAEAVLEQLNTQKAFGVITTHYTNLKHFASASDTIINGAMLYDSEHMKPLYRLSIGNPGSSFAFEIASTIGLPKSLLDNAKQKIGSDHVNFDQNLKDVEKDKQYVSRKILEIEAKEERLRQNLNKYDDKLKELNQKKKEILADAHKQAALLIDDSNKEIEKTIRTIKESQAEKAVTRQARENLALFQDENKRKKKEEESLIEKKIEKIKQKQAHRAKKQQDRDQEIRQKARDILNGTDIQPTAQKPKETRQPKKNNGPLQVHDYVCIKGQSTSGEILEITKKDAIVSFGLMKTKVSLERLIRAEKSTESNQTAHNQANSLADKIYKKRLKFNASIDIRGKRADDAMMQVKDFVEEAIILDVKDIKILHGKGDGILRKFIREYLSTVDVVKSFADAHVELGGAGITMIELE